MLVVLPGIEDLDVHEAAALGVGQELGDRGSGDVQAPCDLRLGHPAVVQVGRVQGQLVLARQVHGPLSHVGLLASPPRSGGCRPPGP